MDALNIKLEQVFEGPLDLLLYLIKSNQINIYDIPIAFIADQFTAYLAKHRDDIKNLSDFIQMTAELVYIKSLMLLPIKDDKKENQVYDPRLGLVEKLLEYKKYKEAFGKIDAETQLRNCPVFIKEPETFIDMEEEWQPVNIVDLVRNFENILKKLPKQTEYVIQKNKTTVKDKIEFLMQRLSTSTDLLLSNLLKENNFDRYDFICLFLAILELVKNKKIVIFQHDYYEDIQIKLQGEK